MITDNGQDGQSPQIEFTQTGSRERLQSQSGINQSLPESAPAEGASTLEQALTDAAEKRGAYHEAYTRVLSLKRVADEASRVVSVLLDAKLNNRTLGL